MQQTSKNLSSEGSQLTEKKMPPFGDCMFNRHEYCKVTLEDGKTCSCTKCGDAHGTKYKPLDLNTPVHVLFRKVFDAHKAGRMYSDSIDPVVELSKQEPPEETDVISFTKAVADYTGLGDAVLEEDEVEDTLEELERKRA